MPDFGHKPASYCSHTGMRFGTGILACVLSTSSTFLYTIKLMHLRLALLPFKGDDADSNFVEPWIRCVWSTTSIRAESGTACFYPVLGLPNLQRISVCEDLS